MDKRKTVILSILSFVTELILGSLFYLGRIGISSNNGNEYHGFSDEEICRVESMFGKDGKGICCNNGNKYFK